VVPYGYLADILRHGEDHDAADGGDGGGRREIGSVLRGLRVAGRLEDAAHAEAGCAGASGPAPAKAAFLAGVARTGQPCRRA